MEDIPAPVPVAELIAQRPADFCDAPDGYLTADEMERAWPVVWRLDAFLPANEVRTASGFGNTYQDKYHAGDVQRIADAIADGTAVLAPHWRKDTKEGHKALRQARERQRLEEEKDLLKAQLAGFASFVLVVFMWVMILSGKAD
ncbi:hypothetical protein AB0I84_27895 [Streptomyces spectabilis]|uniref:hypothetical protein n=1 Tax=Streptomyces spectabilis TaxID=68270 RepID=UPI003406C869